MIPPSIPDIHVDLDRPPAERWGDLAPHAHRIGPMMRAYLADIGDLGAYRPLLEAYVAERVPAELREELEAVAAIAGVAFEEVVAANLYYDAVKLAFGCTAFVRAGPDGPVHHRNLDWWSPNDVLTENTVVVHYHRGGRRHFSVVGWPGFVGALSGVAPGRFAVTLNAVLSDEPAELAEAMTFLLRRALDEAHDYDAAVELLATTPVLSDSLLLISGVEPEQMCVVERTPTRHARRGAIEGVVVVTNDYRALETSNARADDLAATSCARYDRASSLAPREVDGFEILADPEVVMAITTQHMRFVAATGEVDVRLPR